LFYKISESGYRQVLPGIRLKTLVYGEKTLFSEFRMEADSVLPRHSHPHEQTGYLVTGRIRLTIGEQTFEALPGDCWCIPGDTEHSAEILEDSLAVEVFSPVREEYLPDEESLST
jgi:quercetin dioxygenase-like cupin family protein